MRNSTFTAQFRRDLRKVEHRGYDMQKLKTIIMLLLNEEPLPKHCRDHALKGEWKPYRELHIEPDWLLVYKVSENECVFIVPAPMPIFFRCNRRMAVSYCCAPTMRA